MEKPSGMNEQFWEYSDEVLEHANKNAQAVQNDNFYHEKWEVSWNV